MQRWSHSPKKKKGYIQNPCEVKAQIDPPPHKRKNKKKKPRRKQNQTQKKKEKKTFLKKRLSCRCKSLLVIVSPILKHSPPPSSPQP